MTKVPTPSIPIRTSLLATGEIILVLRCCRAGMTSHGGFRWPESGPVEAPDWRPLAECGNGLHGWRWGTGRLDTCDYWNDEGARWLVIEVETKDIIDLNGKIKFPRGTVVFTGGRDEAVSLISEHAPVGSAIHFGTATAGYGGTATAGYGGTATAGYGGQIVIRYWDSKKERYRLAHAEIEANGSFRPGVAYHVVDGQIVAKTP